MFPVAHTRVELTLIKLVCDSRSDPVRGAHLVGEAAVEIIKCLALPPGLGTTKKHLDEADCLILQLPNSLSLGLNSTPLLLPFDRVNWLKYGFNRKYYCTASRRFSNEEWGVGEE
ncbi:hypothetical protein [Microcoleus sp. S28C3]|uniref:hypothetical protein n=1 Tax=Microcoleus sp. S28C3 TaxID=3055414 RepID=UPI00403F45C6